MALLRSLILLAATFTSVAVAENNYPIILVHGFSGWGRNELSMVQYWGAMQGDLQEELNSQGYTVYTASVGPFSSNWDRACELYAQIKGGAVHYGDSHSSQFVHKPTIGESEGLYPEWGEEDENGNIKKVHLVGHSMGGQTVRMLAQLLAHGTEGAPVDEDPSSHELFAGGHDWVASVTTIATPNQGTLLAGGLPSSSEFVKNFLGSTLSLADDEDDTTNANYDAELEQYGIEGKGSDEGISDYIDRIFSSKMFEPGFKDNALWSLSTTGAAEENDWVTTLPNVYYFSFSTADTHASYNAVGQNVQRPNTLTMMPTIQASATILGGRYGPSLGFSEDWQQNDGVVNTISMRNVGDGNSQSFDGTAVAGTWNEMELLDKMDHLAIVGMTLHTQVLDIYTAHAELLYSLNDPDTASNTTAQTKASNVHNTIASAKNSAQNTDTKEDLETLCASNAYSKMAQKYCKQLLDNYEKEQPRLRFGA